MACEVLIIDDDQVVIMIQERMIIHSGFSKESLSFVNGKLGLDYILKNDAMQKKYFILLDINMPVMNGWEFLDAITGTAVAERILVSIVTSSTNESDRQKAESYNRVVSYIEKPVNTEKLHKLLQIRKVKDFFN